MVIILVDLRVEELRKVKGVLCNVRATILTNNGLFEQRSHNLVDEAFVSGAQKLEARH